MDRFQVENPLQNGDLVSLRLEAGREPRFLAARGFACEAPDISRLKVSTGASAAFQSESVFRIEVAMDGPDPMLHYGQSVKLIHMRSESYLAVLTPEKCTLIPGLAHDSPQLYFVVQPRYKLRQEGGIVYNRDSVLLNSRLYPTVHLALGSSNSAVLSASREQARLGPILTDTIASRRPRTM